MLIEIDTITAKNKAGGKNEIYITVSAKCLQKL